MKAAIFTELNAPMSVEEITLDPPGPGEVHVKWVASGVCHSDVSIWQGKIPLPPPAILGHEGAGIVAGVGDGVTDFRTGDHVIGSFVPTCGECYYCKNGQAYVCEKSIEIGMSRMPFTRSDGSKPLPGPGGLSSFAEETVCSPTALVKIPSEFDLEEAALIGCGVTTGVGSALWAAKVEGGETVAVIGCGGVGLSVIQGCRIGGAKNIIAIDPQPKKRKWAEEFGATHSIDPSEADVDAFVRELTGGRGADIAFEVVGVPALQRQAYDLTRPGGKVCWVGVPNITDEVSIPAGLVVLQNKHIIGTIYGSANVKQDFAKLVEFAKKGDLQLKKMVSQEIKIDDINDSFRAMLEGDVIRSVVVYN
jgi:Zn-dependent alcohol dehydrogenase